METGYFSATSICIHFNKLLVFSGHFWFICYLILIYSTQNVSFYGDYWDYKDFMYYGDALDDLMRSIFKHAWLATPLPIINLIFPNSAMFIRYFQKNQ